MTPLPRESDGLPDPRTVSSGPRQSDSDRMWFTVLEFEMGDGMLHSMQLVQFAADARAAAERSAGIQLAETVRPRRIRVYEGEPASFEWRRVGRCRAEVGKRERA